MIRAAASFESNRPRLFAVAYRVLGSRTDAEDVLQDAFLNWSQCSAEGIESPTAFLVTITKRLCFDHLRKRRHEREQCVEGWPAEPVAEEEAASPEMLLESAEETAHAFLALTERLGRDELAAFLLREVFDYDYAEIAAMLGKSEPACRQAIHRARSRAREPRVRFAPPSHAQRRLLERFLVAVRSGDHDDVIALLGEVGGVASASAAPAYADRKAA
jgi:RNA polymerase sigma-70 factor (ECF subfamily)